MSSETGPPDDGYDDEHDRYDQDRYEPYDDDDDAVPGGYVEERRNRLRGCLPALVVLLVIAVGGFYAVGYGLDKVRDKFSATPDYAGPGTGSLIFQVPPGASSADIGRALKKADVVKSVQSFIDAARTEDRSRGIQVGYYKMSKQMKATEALGVLIEAKNLIQSLVTVTEGARVKQIVETIAAKTKIPKKAVQAALKKPKMLGLPPEAEGDPEGYLFPATYTVPPKTTAMQLLKQMVAKTTAVESDLEVEAGAARLGLDSEQILTVASILEYEANRNVDYPKVARVLYNRLDQGMPLQLDSTVSYLSKRSGDIYTTAEERAVDSPYNTYKNAGLPPGPIGSPGRTTIEAALNPAKGDWLFFVPDVEKGTTLFTSSYRQHLRNVAKLAEFCRTSDKC